MIPGAAPAVTPVVVVVVVVVRASPRSPSVSSPPARDVFFRFPSLDLEDLPDFDAILHAKKPNDGEGLDLEGR